MKSLNLLYCDLEFLKRQIKSINLLIKFYNLQRKGYDLEINDEGEMTISYKNKGKEISFTVDGYDMYWVKCDDEEISKRDYYCYHYIDSRLFNYIREFFK